MTKKHFGVCRVCGEYKKLSFEHIPPKKAFNDYQVVYQTIQDSLRGSYSKSRQGMGDYSLCESCNNLTGAWYGDAFVRWSHQGFDWLDKVGRATHFILPFNIMPLNVIKQIMVMMLAMSPSEIGLRHLTEVRRFVLNKELKNFPPQYKVYVYFNRQGKPRFASNVAVMRLDLKEAVFIEAEVSLPPFGYVIISSFKKKRLPDSLELYEITWFSEFDYNIWTSVFLKPPVLETHEPFPLDYRTEAEVEAHYLRNNIPFGHNSL